MNRVNAAHPLDIGAGRAPDGPPGADFRSAWRQLPGVRALPPGLVGQLARFGVIGVLSTLAYTGLFVLLREPLGPQGANLSALLITAVANTALNRRFTFGVSGAHRRTRHLAQGLVVFLLALGLTSGALAAVHAVSTHPPRLLELAVLVVANLTATCLRFVLLRLWVFRHHAAAKPPQDPAAKPPQDPAAKPPQDPAAKPVPGTTSQHEARRS